MARIQTLGSGQKIATGVKVASKQRSVDPVAQAAKTVGALTSQMGGIMKKRSEAEAETYASKSTRELRLEGVNIKKELDVKYAGDPNGYAEEYNARIKEAQNRYAESAPSDLSKSTFTKTSEAFVFSSGMQANVSENKQKNQKMVMDNKNAGKQNSEIQYESPDSRSASISIMNRNMELDNQVGKIGDAKQIAALKQDFQEWTRDGYLQGYLDKQLTNPANANKTLEQGKKDIDAMLTVTPENEALLKGMTPKAKNQFKRKAYRQLESSFAKEQSHVAEKTNLLASNIMMGSVDPSTPAGKALIDGQKNKILSTQSLDQFKKDQMLAKISTSEAVQSMNSDIAMMTPDEAKAQQSEIKADALSGITDDLTRRKVSGILDKNFNKVLTQNREAMIKDGPTYFTQHDKGLANLAQSVVTGDPNKYANYKAQIDSYYEKFNVAPADRKYLPEAVRETYSKSFKAALELKKPAMAEEVLSTIDGMANGNSYRLLKEVGINDKFVAVGELGNSQDRQNALQNIMNSDAINTDFKNVVPDMNNKDIYASLDTDYFKAIQNQNFGSTQTKANAQAMLDVATLSFKQAMANGSNAEEAAEIAWGSFKRTNTQVTGGDQNTNMIIPKKVMGSVSQETINTFIDRTTGESGPVTIGEVIDFGKVAVPAVFQEDLGTYKSMVSDVGFWTFNKQDNRMYLQLPNGSDGKATSLLDKNGTPLSYSLEDVQAMNLDETQSWVERASTSMRDNLSQFDRGF